MPCARMIVTGDGFGNLASLIRAVTGPAWTVPVMDSPAAESVIERTITRQKKY